MTRSARAGTPRVSPRVALFVLLGALLVATIVALSVGASALPLSHLPRLALDPTGAGLSSALPAREHAVFWAIRAPRAVLALVVGFALGVGGAAAQGLFRNPLADPGLVGVSSGATLGAATCLVLAGAGEGFARWAMVPVSAFVTSAAVTFLVVRLGSSGGRGSSAMVILAGVAINALVGSIVGVLSFAASDAELRGLTFWTLGGLGGATWASIGWTLPWVALGAALLFRDARGLDLYSLGETDALASGLDVPKLRTRVVVALALGVGAVVSVAGLVGFVGLVVPHLVRMMAGPRHRALLPLSGIAGAILVSLADTAARTIAAPRELPIGLFTAAIGAPYFLHLLRREAVRA